MGVGSRAGTPESWKLTHLSMDALQASLAQMAHPFAFGETKQQAFLCDEDMANLLRVTIIAPESEGAVVGACTPMHFGQFAWMMAVLCGVLHASPLGPASFNVVMGMQDNHTQQVLAQLGLSSWGPFLALQGNLTRAVAHGAAVAACPIAPAWAPCGPLVTWVQVISHVLEYSAACRDLGEEMVRQAADMTLSKKELAHLMTLAQVGGVASQQMQQLEFNNSRVRLVM